MTRTSRNRRTIFSRPFSSKAGAAERRPGLLGFLWLGFRRLSFAIGALVIISAVLGAVAAGKRSYEPLPERMVLVLNLDSGFEEQLSFSGFPDPFADPGYTVHEIVAALDKASADERIKGIAVRLDGGDYALAHIEEFHDALKRFHAAGKFSYVFSPSYGDVGGLSAYYLASGFEQIWMQPMGILAVPGIQVEMPFFRETLDKIGVLPEFFQRKEYKSAYESLTSSSMSPENREAMEALVADMRRSLTQDISASRKIAPETFDALVDQGIFTTDKAVQARLIDRAAYADDLIRLLKEKVEGSPEAKDDMFVPLMAYDAHPPKHARDTKTMPKVALVYAVGMIVESDIGAQAQAGVFMNEGVAAASELVPAIQDATNDPDIQAIVLRVDSPGGSPSASESILHALKLAQARGKKVIVSMGGTAASGGYWISSSADRIFAAPTTLTGSIGVVGGKMSVAGLSEKLGVNWDRVSWGENAGIWSMSQPFSPSQQAQIEAMLDDVYDGFVARVAAGRKLAPEEVEKIARGRVWSGLRAAQVGLVDELGGLSDALDYTAQTLGAADRKALEVVVLPEPKSPLEQFLAFISRQSAAMQGLARIQSAILTAFHPLVSASPSAVLTLR